ncbi:MAG: sugar ABC transporter substrate-binding protein [bacterium]
MTIRSARHRAASLLVLTFVAIAACGDGGQDQVGASATSEPDSSTTERGPSTDEADPGETGEAAASGEFGCADAAGQTVGFSEPLADPNFAAIESIVANVLKQHDVELATANANLDPGKQIGDIQTLVQQDIGVLIVNPVDPNATQAVLDDVRSRDVPIIALDTLIGGPYFTTVREDMGAAASSGADLLKDAVEDGPVAAIYGPPFAELLNWEKEAFDARAAEIGLNVVETGVNQEITPEGAKAFADAWKQTYGAELAGIWTFNDVSAIGVASALDADFDPVIVSINGQPDVVPLIEDGEVLATHAVPYEKTAQALAYATLAALCGNEVPDEIVVPVPKLDQSNIDEFRPIDERVNDPFDIELEQRDGTSYVVLD